MSSDMSMGHLYPSMFFSGKVSLIVSHCVSVWFFCFLCMCVWRAHMNACMFVSLLMYVSVDRGFYHLSYLSSPHMLQFLNLQISCIYLYIYLNGQMQYSCLFE